MKAFSFRLEQARRWRASQVDLERARVSAAAARLDAIRNSIEQAQNQLSGGSAVLSTTSQNGGTLAAWNAFETSMRAKIVRLTASRAVAEAELQTALNQLVEADRRLKLLDNLKAQRHAVWAEEAARELETFAAESFLGRLQSKRAGA